MVGVICGVGDNDYYVYIEGEVMKIGLFDLDSKYHNLALMKLSAHYKSKGHEVEFYKPLWADTYNKVYVSKMFTKDCEEGIYIPVDAICGGPGFDLKTKLSKKIEHTIPDYSLYGLDYSLGFTTRGCIRNCGFCIVRQKEGNIKEHAEVEEFLNPKSNIIVLLDNNFLALPSHIKKLQKYIKKGWKMDFNQGLDIRLINKENAELLSKVKHYKQIHFAWDQMGYEKQVRGGLKILFKAGINPRKIMIFILCNYDTTLEEDIYRYEELHDLDVTPYVMVYGEGNKEIKKFARYVNRRWISKKCSWKEYNG